MFEQVFLKPAPPFPNSPLPVLLYPGALEPKGDLERAFLTLFQDNNWGDGWVNGVYAFHHFHTTAHEALGCASGWVTVLLGGPGGREFTLKAGDAVLLPAGTAHFRVKSSGDYSIVGAYPKGQSPDLMRGEPAQFEAALKNISKLPLPDSDPVLGRAGPAVMVWGSI